MSSIFISYASADRLKAKALAELLAQRGWSVWWDRKIPPGRTFDQVIEEALDAAQCVIVLWSKASVASDWVRTEAAEGARRRILIPALIEEVKIPLEFRRLQAANLSNWPGASAQAEVEELLHAVAGILGAPPTSLSAALPHIFRSARKKEITSLTEYSGQPLPTKFQQRLQELIGHATDDFQRIKGKLCYRAESGSRAYETSFSLPGALKGNVWQSANGKFYFTCDFVSSGTLAQAEAAFDEKVKEIKAALPADWTAEVHTSPSDLAQKELIASHSHSDWQIRLTLWVFATERCDVDLYLEH